MRKTGFERAELPPLLDRWRGKRLAGVAALPRRVDPEFERGRDFDCVIVEEFREFLDGFLWEVWLLLRLRAEPNDDALLKREELE